MCGQGGPYRNTRLVALPSNSSQLKNTLSFTARSVTETLEHVALNTLKNIGKPLEFPRDQLLEMPISCLRPIMG